MYKHWNDWEDARLEIIREFKLNKYLTNYEHKYYNERDKAEKLEQKNKVLQSQFDELNKMAVEVADRLNAIRSSKAYKVLKWIERLFSYRIKLINKTDNLK